ncbi:hypothetical protein K432DRAFT_377285 [Lepidopterella palustris CBS 459.81]|uniref:Zn(2)-C6 fungal-type domain-containing protein n=1 Tax=Lepidopterella palustris CBS 459.81 TaxID=1314670 RepID=A0A8E2JKI4_9PEZI|nr:hypothetical protein K432DRAFT_377285 [Lepidopterella palustris CBS 459.81]
MATKRKLGTSNVDEGNQKPVGKRQRVSRACDQCRTAREKCDGIQPICFTCASSNRDCSYTTNPKKRGIQPGYIRTLELSLAWIFTNVIGSEAAVHAILTQDGAQGSALLVGKDTDDSYKLHKKWRRSTVCKEIERLLSGSEGISNEPDRLSPDTPEAETRADAGAEQAELDSAIGQSDVNRNAHLGRGTVVEQRAGDGEAADTVKIVGLLPQWHIGMPEDPPESSGTKKLKLPTDLWRLFDVYFAYTHCWFPIAEKHDVLKVSYSYPEDGLEVQSGTPGSGDHAELWSILAVASIQELSGRDIPNEEEENQLASSNIYYATARSLIPSEQGKFELGHVKALLILTLINLGQDNPQAAWLLAGHAVRIAVSLEQQRTSRLQMGERAETGSPRFRHVLAGCFLLDTVIATQLKRRPYLKSSEVRRWSPLDEEGLEEWHPWVGCHGFGVKQDRSKASSRSPVQSLSIFNRLTDIVCILNDQSQSSEKTMDANLLESATRLEAWNTALPLNCTFLRTGNSIATPTPPMLLLRLIYLCAVNAVDASSSQVKSQIVGSFQRFIDQFGLVTIPPIAFSFLDLASGSRLQHIKAEYFRVWRKGLCKDSTPYTNNEEPGASFNTAPNPHIFTMSASKPSNFQLPTPESVHAPFHSSSHSTNIPESNRPQPRSTLFEDLLPSIGPSAIRQPSSSNLSNNHSNFASLDSAQIQPPNNEARLERYNPANSLDLEDFLDELASLDGAERLDAQPRFMQNLGFAPDANIMDVLASEYGPFDPVLDEFFHQGDVGPSLPHQSRPFDGS